MTCKEIRLGSITGLPVILNGRKIGRVEKAVLTPDGRALRGLVTRQGLGGAKWIPGEAASVLGQVSVVTAMHPGRVPRDADFSFGSVRDTAGLHIGRVTDVFLDADTRRITALEVSLGLVEELTVGRLLAREYVVRTAPSEPGQVLIPCGYALEKPEREGVKK